MHPAPRRLERLSGTMDTSTWGVMADMRQDAVIRDDFRNSEAFILHLSEGRKTVELGGEAALRYAWGTLESWRGGDAVHTACVHIEDRPEFPIRGFMLDISRCKVPTRDSLARWVDWMAGFRFNHFQLYTEHAFAYSGHETVWRDASPVTAEDIHWLKVLCRERGIELVPNQNCFGHFERWIRHEGYRKFAESPDGFVTPWGDRRPVGSVLKPDVDSLSLVRGLLDELVPNFDSGFVNIGCDETFELGQGASRERCEREGMAKVYTDFLCQIMGHVTEVLGRRPMFWGDILMSHPEQIPRLPGDAVALEWGYEADHPFERDAKRFADAGLDFLLCPGTSSWNSFGGRTDNMVENLRAAGHHAKAQGALGLLLTDWGDNGHLQMEEVSALPLAWAGLQAWNPSNARLEDAYGWSDRVVFGGRAGETERWAELGRMDRHLGWSKGNSNAFFNLFLNAETQRGRIREIPDARLALTLDALGHLRAPGGDREAWEQTVRNMTLSVLREMDRRQGTRRADALEAEAVNAHERLWRQRNREGGLAESLLMYSEGLKR